MAKSLSFTEIGKSCLIRDFFTSLMSFNAIRENEILFTKIKFRKFSEFTVSFLLNSLFLSISLHAGYSFCMPFLLSADF